MRAGMGGSSKQETKIPPPTPSELYFRRLFMNTIMPTMMKTAGFDVKARDKPLFLGYADTEKHEQYIKGETQPWTGRKKGGQWEQQPGAKPGPMGQMPQPTWKPDYEPAAPSWGQLQERFG